MLQVAMYVKKSCRQTYGSDNFRRVSTGLVGTLSKNRV